MASFRKRGKTWQYRLVVIDPFSEKKREYTEKWVYVKKRKKCASRVSQG